MDNVIVTGASRGIGFAIAARLAREGYGVIGVARKPSEAFGRAAEELGGAGALHFEPFDLNDVAAIPAFVRGLKERRGPIYGLVNNAGVGTGGLLATMPNVDIEALLRLNTLAPIVLTKYVVRGMMAEGRGRIVTIASIVAAAGYNGLSVYSASKGALVSFTRALAREVGRVGVTVNAIAPGFVDTELTRSSRRRAARPHRRPDRAAPADRRRGRRGDGGAADGRGRPQHHRRGADGRRRRHGVITRNICLICRRGRGRRAFLAASVGWPTEAIV